jgi:hypothetical protein
MGQAKQRASFNKRFLAEHPFCIFCGGTTPSSTVDHVPPIVMFAGRQRPKGLEFAACSVCNNGTRHADLLAAFLGRSFPDPVTATDRQDIDRILKALSNNIPQVLAEMKSNRGAEKLAMRKLPASLQNQGGILKLDGPLVSSMLNLFAYKISLALFYEASKQPLKPDGEIVVRVFSNYERFTGDFPEHSLSFLGTEKTLVQGKKHVGDQFSFATAISEEGYLGSTFATFRMGFAVLAFIAQSPQKLKRPQEPSELDILTPTNIKQLIVQTGKSTGALQNLHSE